MKILNYLQSLLPSIGRQRIIDNIQALQSDLSGFTLKAFAEAGALFAKKKFQYKANQDFDQAFHNRLKGNRTVNFVAGIEAIFKGLSTKLAYIETLVNSNYSADIARDGMSYQKATVLKYLEVVEFATTYGRRLLINVLAAETYVENGTPELIGTDEPPAMAKWMAAHKQAFIDALSVLALPFDETKEKIEAIPDIAAVPEHADVMAQTVGASKLDPLGLGFIITTWLNPVYHLRMAFSEWQVERYKAKQAEKQALEFGLLALEESYSKKQDPKLQERIKYNRGRLNDLNRRLAEIEEDYVGQR